MHFTREKVNVYSKKIDNVPFKKSMYIKKMLSVFSENDERLTKNIMYY